jgi:hypothetical protein
MYKSFIALLFVTKFDSFYISAVNNMEVKHFFFTRNKWIDSQEVEIQKSLTTFTKEDFKVGIKSSYS